MTESPVAIIGGGPVGLAAMRGVIRTGTRVVNVSRRNCDKVKDGDRERAPFQLHVIDDGLEALVEARAVQLNLPETGVCVTETADELACCAPAVTAHPVLLSPGEIPIVAGEATFPGIQQNRCC